MTASEDRFAGLLGSQRGTSELDELTAQRPTPAARAAVGQLVGAAREARLELRRSTTKRYRRPPSRPA